MINQPLHTFDKATGLRQLGVNVERVLIDPMRVEPEEPRVADTVVGCNRETTRFGARPIDGIAQLRCHRGFLTLDGVKSGEDE